MDKINIPPLNLPPVECKFKKEGNLIKIFDPFRQKYVRLTPEELVRRHFSEWLVKQFHYPASCIANEVGLHINNTQKRCDTLIVDSKGKPFMIVEYKAPEVKISQNTFDQIVRYNMVFRAKYLVVSNGMYHYCCVIDYQNSTYHFIPTIPDYNNLAKPIA